LAGAACGPPARLRTRPFFFAEVQLSLQRPGAYIESVNHPTVGAVVPEDGGNLPIPRQRDTL